MGNANRIVYIEPNSLPAKYAAKASPDVRLDNITWAPEDLNISVDLQVVIPSRAYRESDKNSDIDVNSNFDVFNKLNKYQSILSGVELKPNASFLTDDYTTMSYQEIKNNKSGSKEMLGINSIGIDFDSHLYPKVRMTFTDVRGASLMMPQEQYVYDINSQAGTGQEVEESAVCKNFFQSFFKFPYPRFLLSVKGIYGTCVTFVLSVEDFKATFNSDTGNFDVVVTFIGNMYGLYTDIPMNYLIIAPYIGGRNGKVNEYWKKNTENGGAFFYNEDGANGEPIQTYVEFRHSFKNFSDNTNGGAVFGANMAQIARKQKTIRYIKMLQAQIRELPKNLETPTICYNLNDGSNGHVLFKIEENGDSNFIVNEDYTRTFQKIYEEDDEVGKLVKPEEGTVFSYLIKGKNVIAGEPFKDNIINDKGVYSLSPSEGSYLSNDINEFNNFINGKDAADAGKICKATDILYYDEKFLNGLSSAEIALENEIESLSNAASQETIDIFKSHFKFTPTIENVMRMLFAHLDTFIHKFYELIRKIQPNRTLSKIGCKKENTDIQAPGSDAFVPPFTAFFNSKNGKRVYPTDAGAFIEEVNFVESMFNGMEERLTSEAALEAQKRSNTANASASTVPNNVKVKFNPIAVTDIFYNGVNPYDFLNTADEITVYDLIYFFICRFYLGIRGYEKEKYNSKKAIVEAIINKELENLKNSSLWGTLTKKPNFRNELDSIDYEKIGNVVGASASVPRSEIFKVTYTESGYKIEKRDSGNSEFYKFNGTTQLISDTASTRKDIEGFDCIVKDKPNGREYNENDIREFQKAYTIPSKEAEKKFSAVKTDNPVCPYRNDTLAGNLLDLITRKTSNGYASLIQPLKDGTPVVLKTEAGSQKKAKSYEKGKNEEIVIFDDGQIWMPEGNVWKHNCKAQDLLNNNKNTSDNLWIPIALFRSNKGNMINLFSEMCKKNSKVFLSGDIYQKAAMFLTALQDACGFKIDYLNSGTTDGIYIIPSVLKYLFGGYQYLINTVADQTFVDYIEARVKGIKSFKDAISNDFVWDFSEWAEGTFSRIEAEVAKDLAKEEDYYEVKRKNYYSNTDQTFKALSPSTPLQTTLLALLREKSCVSLFTNALEEGTVLEKNIDKAYVTQFVDSVIDALPVNPTIESVTDLELSDGSLSIDKSQKDSLYYTLKNLYDRWLSTYTSNTFKLKSVPEERRAKEKKMEDDEKGNSNTAITISEFDNFLYVDSFYNDISKDFFVNPSTLFDIINSQIVGDSNYNVYEFIARICEKNKLLLQCLPVYNNLYSQKTFEEIFKPHSLYYGPERTHRRLGNTYLIMYTYEQSHHLNLAQDKTNDVSFSNDGFDIADIYGEITPDAMELFPQSSDKKNYNICAFGVTPGAQNQSYFTRISVGMDNPRITDFAIKNLFQLSSMAKNGRAEGVGVGQDMYSIYSNRAYDCRVEMMGCANIMPMMYFQLNNVPMFRGTYMIKKVEHHIQNNTMTTTFTGTRMSRRHIPFNQAIFNVEALVSALEGVDKNKDSYVTIGVQTVKVHNDDTVERITSESTDLVPQPAANYDNSREFNVWAAINQMYQVLYTVEEGKTFRPLIDKKAVGEPSPAICATAVELFLMAGFNGLFPANNKQQAVVINGYRGKTEVAVNGVKFEGENGYNMKNKLAALGFACIATGADEVTKMQNNHRLQECDVCVMKPPKNHPTEYGHVCMWAGDENPKWISDYMQVNGNNTTYWWPYKVKYKDAGLEKTDVLLYRYTGKKISETKLYGSWENGTFVPGRDNTDGTNTVPTEQA